MAKTKHGSTAAQRKKYASYRAKKKRMAREHFDAGGSLRGWKTKKRKLIEETWG